MDLSCPSDTSSLTDLSQISEDSGCGRDYIDLTTPTEGSFTEEPTLEWVICKMMERENMQQLHKEKIEACHQFDLPLDPWKWTSTDVTKWASWFARKIDPKGAQEVIQSFETYPITGEILANFSEEDMRCYFTENSSKAHQCLQTFLEGMSPRGFDLQRQLLELQNKTDSCLTDLCNEVRSSALTPPHSAYDIPLQPDDVLPGINNNIIVQNIKEESSAFPFADPSMTDYQHTFQALSVKCQDTLPHITHAQLIGSCGFFADNIEPIKLDIDSEIDEPNKLCIVKKEASYPPTPVKRKRGRPRKPKFPKQKREQPILYKFILKHLNDATGDSRKYLEWVNKSEGLFRFYSSKKDNFAELWGHFKGKREQMSYQNMARALRNYTRGIGNRKIMMSVRKKLHYKFTPNFIQ